jgi:hypothetical protein
VLSIGSALPDTVELHKLPNAKYRYVVIDNQTVIVDPGTRKIVKVIQVYERAQWPRRGRRGRLGRFSQCGRLSRATR